MTWQPYNLDREAQRLVLKYRNTEGAIGQSHKMRTTVAFGLERFWGEHLRLLGKTDSKDKNKGKYWRDTWKTFAGIMLPTGIKLPSEDVDNNDSKKITEVANKLWSLDLDDQRICLAVLTQFCDSLVWWTQRYKIPGSQDDG